MQKRLIAISGPTAVGKTAISIELARFFQTEIISFDSRQFYKELSIGTAKRFAVEQQCITHHFIDNLSIHDRYTVADYQKEALHTLNRLFKNTDLIIAVGGSGLFLKSIIEGLDHIPPISENIKNHVEKLYKEKGLSALQDQLLQLDPQGAAQIDLLNPRRLMRALMVYKQTQKSIVSYRKKKPKRPFKTLHFFIDQPRDLLYKKINNRVDKMIQAGLIEECQSLLPHESLPSLNTVGYKEIFSYLHKKISKQQAIENIKKNTRNYAKRQKTWFYNQGFDYRISNNQRLNVHKILTQIIKNH